MAIMVVLAGLFAFNFWEPLADLLEPGFRGTFLAGTEDLLTLTILFCLAIGLMRWGTNYLSPHMIEYHGAVQRMGAGVIGIGTGYLVAGFLLCVVETLPLDEHFLGFETRTGPEAGMRNIFPSDRVWLAMMRKAGAYPLHSTQEHEDDDPVERYLTFDRYGTFELRYARYRRHTEVRGPLPYAGEFDPSVRNR
jgi:hypothetical protein